MAYYSITAMLGLNSTGYQIGMKRAEGAAKQLGATLKSAMAGAVGAGAITALSTKLINMADDLTDLSDRLDISTDDLQAWAYGAKFAGTSMEAFTKFVERLKETRDEVNSGSEAGRKLAEVYERLGISAEQLANIRGGGLAKALAEVVRTSDLDKISSDLKEVGGRTAMQLSVMFKESFDEIKTRAQDAGQIFSGEALTGLKALKDEANMFVDTFSVVLVPALVKVGQWFSYLMGVLGQFGALFGGIGGALAGGASLSEAIKIGQESAAKVWKNYETRRAAIASQGKALSAPKPDENKPMLGPDMPAPEQFSYRRGFSVRLPSGRTQSIVRNVTGEEMKLIARYLQNIDKNTAKAVVKDLDNVEW
jgi:hypothetical protein